MERKPGDNRNTRSTHKLRWLTFLAIAGVAASCVGLAAVGQHRPQQRRLAGPYTINFTLPASTSTSAGIFGSDGHLVRTLWGNQAYSAGTYQQTWDGNDDLGNAVSPDAFTVKLLTHNVSSNWDGTIGNSSTYSTGPTKLIGLGGVIDVLTTGSTVYLLRNYNEAGEKIDKFDRGAPGEFTPSGLNSFGIPRAYFATGFSTDGVRMYVCATPNAANTTNPNPIVCAYNLDETSGPWTFTGITPIGGGGVGQNSGGQWLVLPTGTGGPNSVAVQKRGNLLAISQVGLNQVDFVDKLSGLPVPAPEGVLSVPAVLAIRWSPDDQTLWTASGTDVIGWQFTNNAWTSVSTLHGTSEVKSFAVNPADGSIAILYGGADQQVRAYTPGGTWLYTIGTRGGYANGPAVNDTKFMIAPLAKWITGGIAFQDDGKLWVLDDGNMRILRFPVHRHLAVARRDAEVRWLVGYMLAVDPNNPDRMIAEGYQEFARDYTQPPSRGNEVAWKLVNNWGYGYNCWIETTSVKDGVIDMVTAANGHTYAILWPASFKYPRVVELTAKGVRDIAQVLDTSYLAKDMSIWYWQHDGTKVWALKAALTGFDANNNHVWGPQSTYCTAPQGLSLPSYSGGFSIMGGMPAEPFPDGSMPSFNTDVGPLDYNTFYLGFIKPGATDYWVKTAKGGLGTPLPHDGHMPLILPSSLLMPDIGGRTCGDLVAIFANGEFFDSAEANQILIYHSSGLFVTDFGTRSDGTYPQSAPSGRSGNFLGNAFVQCSDGNTRILHSDESGHAGIHEWTLQNLNSIKVASAAFDATNTANFGTVSLVAKPKLLGRTLSAPPTTDNFNRPDSPVVGNGWLDPSSVFAIQGGRLKLAGNIFEGYGDCKLLRPEVVSDSDQTIQIPAQCFDSTKMWSFPGVETCGIWGILSRLQSDGSRYFGAVQYIKGLGTNPPDIANGRFDILIGMILGGTMQILGVDVGKYLPASPGHSYSLELTTSGIAPTYLHLVVTDTTTGKVYATLDQISDQPEFQRPGQIGIQAGFGSNEFSAYTATTSNGSEIRRLAKRQP